MTSKNQMVAIITGGSRGFGLATARALAERGWQVVIDARGSEALEAAAEELGEGVTAMPGDVTDAMHRQALVTAAEGLGGLDALINNASTLGPSPRPMLEQYPIAALRRVYEVNVEAPLALIQATLPLLRQSHGVIVNVTSDAGREPYAGWGGYGSSKAALDQISHILAAEETGVSIYTFDPGDMNTLMHQQAFPGEDISDRPPPESSVPALLALLESRPEAGSYSASGLLTAP